MPFRHLFLVGCVAMMGLAPASAQKVSLVIDAGGMDRLHSIADFEWPASLGVNGDQLFASEDGQHLVRVRNGMATLLVRKIPAGQSMEIRVERMDPSRVMSAISAIHHDGRLSFLSAAGQTPVEYLTRVELPEGRGEIDPLYHRAGYLHPVRTPSGVVISDDYPEAHTHHHGIWFPWTKTVFQDRHPDFWNMGGGTGRVEFTALDSFHNGPVYAGFSTRHRFIDMTADPEVTALHETWTVRVYAPLQDPVPCHIFDLHSVQFCATESPLILPEYRYGGLGFRGHEQWNGVENCHFLTSNGETDRIKAHATRANWCHIGGQVDGRWAGMAILCHPDNFRSPQPMRIHPHEPFFNFAPSQAGDWAIEPGKPHVSRYRFVVTDGKPDPEFLNRLWNDYATPPSVTVKTLSVGPQ